MIVTKQILKNYLQGNYDVTFKQIVEDLDINRDQFGKIHKCIRELVEEMWIHSIDGKEYDSASAQGKEFDIGMWNNF